MNAFTEGAREVLAAGLEALGIFPSVNKTVIERAKAVKVEDCLKIDGGDLLTDYLSREIGKAGYLKLGSPINWDPNLGEAGEHTLDSVKLTANRKIAATTFKVFGETHPVVQKKSFSLRRQKAAEATYIPLDYLYPGKPTMIDILSFVITQNGVLLMGLPNGASEKWAVEVVKPEREVLV